MNPKTIRLAGLLLSAFGVAMLVRYFGSPLYLVGALYLVAAANLNAFAVVLVARLRKIQKRGIPEPAAWTIQTRVRALTLCGWQLAIVGVLNLWQSGFSETRRSVILGYLLIAIFAVAWFKMVAMADCSKQEGGYRPVSYFGRPRPRWLIFCGFIVVPMLMLVDVSIQSSGAERVPAFLRPPLFWLLVAALMSLPSAGLVFHRYRRVAANRTLATRVLVGLLAGLGITGSAQAISGYNRAVYVLSSIIVACVAASGYSLSLARMRELAPQDFAAQ